jgi:hypothetical protein
MQHLIMSVEVGAGTIQLRMGRSAGGYHLDEYDGLMLHYATLRESEAAAPVMFGQSDDVMEFSRQMATQIEGLLYVGHMVQLPSLLQTVHGFIFRSHILNFGILRGKLHRVFTDRVLAAAVGSSQPSRDAYITSVLTHPCSAHGDAGLQRLLKGAQKARFDKDDRELCWDAKLAKDFFGCAAGSQVNVKLDLLSDEGPAICFGEDGPWLQAQILLGPGIYNEQARQEFLEDNATQ